MSFLQRIFGSFFSGAAGGNLPSEVEVEKAARAAADSGDWPGALKLWEVLKTRMPGLAAPYSGAAIALLALDRPEDVDVLLTPALRTFPDDIEILNAYALAAQRRGEWVAAIPRWLALLHRSPGSKDALIELASAYRGAGSFDEADATLQDAMKLGQDSNVIFEYARLAASTGNWHEAESRWRRASELFPEKIEPYCGIASALENAGHADKAQETLAQAIERFPQDTRLLDALGWLAGTQKN